MANQELKITEIDAVTGEVIERSFTPDEVKAYEAIQKEEEARKAELQAIAEAKASARAKLAALGLTEAEIAAL